MTTGKVHLVAPQDRVVTLSELHQRYQRGATIRDLAGELGINAKTLAVGFGRAGLALRARGGRAPRAGRGRGDQA